MNIEIELDKDTVPIFYIEDIDFGGGCQHDFKLYVGFTETYNYCIKCNFKEKLC